MTVWLLFVPLLIRIAFWANGRYCSERDAVVGSYLEMTKQRREMFIEHERAQH